MVDIVLEQNNLPTKRYVYMYHTCIHVHGFNEPKFGSFVAV